MGKSKRKNNKPKERFEHRLVLANWLFDIVGLADFKSLQGQLKHAYLEGFNEDGTSRYLDVLRDMFDRPKLPNDLLTAYDEHIVRHWKAITERRNAAGNQLYPKYFQYIGLLFTEIYLDKFFRDPESLLSELNEYLQRYNRGETEQQRHTVHDTLQLEGIPLNVPLIPFTNEDLRKLAFWSATGSGKTLLMHIHIRQYRHYLKLHGRETQLNRIILLTPNEGLSRQHLEEFKSSGMEADLFDKEDTTLFTGRRIEILDIHKLKEKAGDKTIAVEAFEGNNLVLVDEGHRGASGSEIGQWMEMRARLCENGFSFEYSATFGQAMKASGNKKLLDEYAKSILFDYSYKYFYGDGYGKEYRILNLEDDSKEEHRKKFLTACLLTFYQQQKVYETGNKRFTRYLIEKPLWIFVGGSVTKSSVSAREVSDVVDILLFLSQFIANRGDSIRYIDAFLNNRGGLNDEKTQDLFAGKFNPLIGLNMTADEVYIDILEKMFNAKAPGKIHVRKLKSGGDAEGEIALHLGDQNDPFGVINVGDSSKLSKLCEEHEELVVTDSEFTHSLFHKINKKSSSINILIGSKKFSEGWSSWRVSTMGLMNVGRGEGSQIIQLFGRGVRLKGMDFSLKRSKDIPGEKHPKDIQYLETLNVFGIRADYMQQFKEYLEEEGLTEGEDRVEWVFPVIKNLGNMGLKIIRLPEDRDFKKNGLNPSLRSIDGALKGRPIVLDWYPKIKARESVKANGNVQMMQLDENVFRNEHLAFLNYEAIYFELQQMKNERAWYNLNLNREAVRDILADASWYTILIPDAEMDMRSFDQVRQWQEMAIALMKKYCDRVYKHAKGEYEKDLYIYEELKADDPNFIEEYRFLIAQSEKEIITRLNTLKDAIKVGKLNGLEFPGGEFLHFSKHLYQPLVHVSSSSIEVKPVSLNEGEKEFVEHLRAYCETAPDFFKNKNLYLLRNMSRGRGVGFFEAGNFHPDFILWLLVDGKQYINFVDPKGLARVKGFSDPKIEFHKTIKHLEERMHSQDDTITLNSFIISNTRHGEVDFWGDNPSIDDFNAKNVYFQFDQQREYVRMMLEKIVGVG